MNKLIFLFCVTIALSQNNGIRSLNGSLNNSQRLTIDTSSSVSAFAWTLSNGVHTLEIPYRIANLSAGGAVGDADSLGGVPASGYVLVSDSSSRYVTKSTTQEVSGTKYFTSTQNFNTITVGAIYSDSSNVNINDSLNVPFIRIIGGTSPEKMSVWNDRFEVFEIDSAGAVSLSIDTSMQSSNATLSAYRNSNTASTGATFALGRGRGSNYTGLSGNLSGDIIGGLYGFGRTSSGSNTGFVSAIRFVASQNWTSSSNGTYIDFATTNTGATSRSVDFIIDKVNGLPRGTFGTTAGTGIGNLYIDSLYFGSTLAIDGSRNTSFAIVGGTSADITGTVTSTLSTGINFKAQSNTTDATTKVGSYTLGHYTNSEEPLTLIRGQSTSGASLVQIGGGSGVQNSATSINFYTSANNTTTTGTVRMILDETSGGGRLTLGATAGTGIGNLFVDTVAIGTTVTIDGSRNANLVNITSTGTIDGGSAIADTSSFTTTATRKAVYIQGATSTDKYSITWRNLTGDEATIPTEVPFYYAKTDSLIVMRSAGTTSGLKFSFIRIR